MASSAIMDNNVAKIEFMGLFGKMNGSTCCMIEVV
jgi:hypothetical protein